MNFRQLSAAFALALSLVTVSSAALAATFADDVVSTLYAMRGVYSSQYAPAAWKMQHAGYDLNNQFAQSLLAVQNTPLMTVPASRAIFKDFIYAMKDYHTSISFTSTESASLPLKIRGAGDREFIVEIDRTKLSAAAFPFSEGDELVTVDGVPVADAVTALQSQIIVNVPGTDRALAEVRFFSRSAARGVAVPQGPVTLGIRRRGQSTVSNIQLIWTYTPERVQPRGDFLTAVMIDIAIANRPSTIFNPQMSVKLVDAVTPQTESPFDIGARKSFIPDLGMKLWESAPDALFYAYTYMNADRKVIGYVRIPSYSIASATASLAEFASLMIRFQRTTDSLVIDQVNNPGGSVFYLYTLASMLSDQPLRTPRHRMAINQKDITEALQMIDQLRNVRSEADAQAFFGPEGLGGYPTTYETARFLLSYAEFLVSEWNAGRRLTNPYWIAGVDHINPSSSPYTKPVLILINELDFSGGDFFPTILQDNQRVKILGARTAGAGGYVNDVQMPNNVGIDSFRVTGSIAERVSGNPIENLGVTPDVPYELTADDFQTGFAPYVRAIQAAVKSITP